VDGRAVTGSVAVPQVEDWDRYETVSLGGVPLEAGRHVVRLVMGPEDFMDLQWIAIDLESNGPIHPVPGRIEAEDYDLGGQRVGYFDTTPANEQGFSVYRTDDVDVKASVEGGYAIGWIAAAEWLGYTVDVESAGSYRLDVRVGSAMPGRTFHVEVDGTAVTGAVGVPEVADWDRYQTISVVDVPMPAGRHLVRVVMGPEDFMDLQWLAIVR
jgi:hypothetical protein